MCGRIVLTSDLDQIKQHFAINNASAVLTPRYNISPDQMVVIIDNNQRLEFIRWGLNLTNTVGSKINKSIINARIENISSNKIFSKSFKKQRCLIVTNGFFEWKTIGNKKIPFYIQSINKEILALAGIIINNSCLIITTQAREDSVVSSIHPRMPLIINKKSYSLWLDLKTPINLLFGSVLQMGSSDLVVYPVSTEVNNPKFDNLVCIASTV